VLLQAEVNTEDEDDENEDQDHKGSPITNQNPDKLYPSAPLDESSDGSTASAHSTSV